MLQRMSHMKAYMYGWFPSDNLQSGLTYTHTHSEYQPRVSMTTLQNNIFYPCRYFSSCFPSMDSLEVCPFCVGDRRSPKITIIIITLCALTPWNCDVLPSVCKCFSRVNLAEASCLCCSAAEQGEGVNLGLAFGAIC